MASKKWLNENIYTQNPLDEPLISYHGFMKYFSYFIMSAVLIIVLFVPERDISKKEDQIESPIKKENKLIEKFGFNQVVNALYLLSKNKNIQFFLLYLIVNRSCEGFVSNASYLKI